MFGFREDSEPGSLGGEPIVYFFLGDLQHDVDLLKLDCEGAEFDILMSLRMADARKIRRIIVETTSDLYDVDQLNAITHLGLHHVTVFRRRYRVLQPLYHQEWDA